MVIKSRWHFRLIVSTLVLLSVLSLPSHALNIDLSSVLPSSLYWFVHITQAGRLELIALVRPQHTQEHSAQGSTLLFYPLPQTVSGFQPEAAAILNADWHQSPTVSVQLIHAPTTTTYVVANGLNRYSVQAGGRSDLEPFCTAGHNNQLSRYQLFVAGGYALLSGYFGMAHYCLWHVWHHFTAPHSSFSVLQWLLSSAGYRAGEMPQPPLATHNPAIVFSYMEGFPVPLRRVGASLFRPWQSVMGTPLKDAPSVPSELVDEAMSGSPHSAMMSIVDRALPLCGGLRQFSIQGLGNALLWECPRITRGGQSLHGGYLGLISHSVLMRTLYFQGSQSERDWLNEFDPDLPGKTDSYLPPDKN